VCKKLTGFVRSVGDTGRVVAGLNTLDRAHFELVARSRRQVVQHHMKISGDGRQSLAERLNSLYVTSNDTTECVRFVC